MQDFCVDSQRDGSNAKIIPEEIILTIDLPLIRDSVGLDADVVEDGWYFELKSEKQAAYRLKLKLLYQVDDMKSKAAFDKDARKLVITLKTVVKYNHTRITYDAETDQDQVDDKEDEIGTASRQCDSDISIHQKSFPENIPKPAHLKQETFSSSGESTEIGSPGLKKTVRFSDDVQKQVYRSNSSILGQKKKNQRKAKNKRKVRERLNSGESISDEDGSARSLGKNTRERFNSGGSFSSMDDEEREDDNEDDDAICEETWKEDSTNFPHLLV